MSRPPRPPCLFPLSFAALFLAGCGGAAVEGVVTLDGKPLAGALVRYVPGDSGADPAEGTTDATGTFRLATANGQPVKPGTYKIVVRKDEVPPVDPSLSPQEKMEARRRALQQPRVSVVPARYTAAETTPLSGVVPPAGRVTLELTGK